MNRIFFPGAQSGLVGFVVTALVMVTTSFGPANSASVDAVAQYDSHVRHR